MSLAVAAFSALLAAAAPGAGPLQVRASALVAPCVESAVRAWPAPHPAVEVDPTGLFAPGPADAFVASAVELTRALESGRAEIGTDADVARVPWVVQARAGAPAIRSAADLAGVEVAVPNSPAAFEAVRWARAATGGRARAASAREMRESAVVLVPLSLATPGDRIGVDVPAIVVRAALGSAPARDADARAFLAFLGSETGQRAFAACRPTP
jgi:hypothetical protein